MGNARAQSPLAHRRAELGRVAESTGGAIAVVDEALLAQVDLRLDPRHERLLPFRLPLEPNTTVDAGERSALWLGPDEWLVVGPPGTVPETMAELELVLDGAHHSVVDVSAGRTVLSVHGRARHELLSKGCSLDLHASVWAPGRCAQTLLARAQVILEERAESTRLYVRPSFGDYVSDWLLDATVEFRSGTGPAR